MTHAENVVRFPLMITEAMKVRLHAKGWDDDQISKMTPEHAWELLGGHPEPAWSNEFAAEIKKLSRNPAEWGVFADVLRKWADRVCEELQRGNPDYERDYDYVARFRQVAISFTGDEDLVDSDPVLAEIFGRVKEPPPSIIKRNGQQMPEPDGGWADAESHGPPVGAPVEPPKPPRPPLPPTVKVSSLVNVPLREREYIAPNFLPFREVSLLNGHGGSLKTMLMLQTAVAIVLGTDVLGFAIKHKGPVIIYSAEEELGELQRRLYRIMQRLGGSLADLSDLHLICLDDAHPEPFQMELTTLDKDGRHITPTPAFHELMARCEIIKPALIGLENVSDLFPEGEINREIVSQQMNIGRWLPRKFNCAEMLLQHVSNSGKSTSGEQTSGSTQWHNKARYRMSLETPKVEVEAGEAGYLDKTRRIWKFWKNQYGDLPSEMPVTLLNELGYLTRGNGGAFGTNKDDLRDEETFLTMLDRDAERGIFWGVKRGTNYIVAAFFKHEEGLAMGKTRVKEAMARLFKKKAIKNAPEPNRVPSKASMVVQRERGSATMSQAWQEYQDEEGGE
jgi:RecA-family ATPase